MEIQVDPLLCEANARCVTVAPEVFALDDDEILQITQPDGGIEPARVERAVASCPLNALSFREAAPPSTHP